MRQNLCTFSSSFIITKRHLYKPLLPSWLSRWQLRIFNCSFGSLSKKDSKSDDKHYIDESNRQTSLISASEYNERRHRLVESFRREAFEQSFSGAQVAVFPSAAQLFSSYHVPYFYRQNSDFLYLTGLNRPGSVLVCNVSSDENFDFALFVEPYDRKKELWEGHMPSVQDIAFQTGIPNVHEMRGNNLENYLNQCLKESRGRKQVMLRYDDGALNIDRSIASLIETFMIEAFGGKSKRKVLSPVRTLHELRWRKSPAEISCMQASCNIISLSLESLMAFSRRNTLEADLVGNLEFEVRRRGAVRLAFPPVVAGGSRACTIHYLNADQKINNDDMVLVDCGCVYQNYLSDLTRTWPVSGAFSQAQLLLYETLLEVQKLLLDICASQRPLSINDLYSCMVLLLGEQLQKIGLFPSSMSKEDCARGAERFCPHNVGHYLGIDLHDTDSIEKSRNLEAGVVITVEPGLYIQKQDTSVPEEFRGIGIRIEDDVLFTDTGISILTEKCPKSITDVEQAVCKSSS